MTGDASSAAEGGEGLVEIARGTGGLALDAVHQVASLVEAVHAAIARLPSPFAGTAPERAGGVAGLVYEVVRRVTGGARVVLDGSLGLLASRGASSLPQAALGLRSLGRERSPRRPSRASRQTTGGPDAPSASTRHAAGSATA